MYFKFKLDARKAYERFVERYYDGDGSNIVCQVSSHDRGYVVSVYDLNGNFLTLL